MQWTTCLCGETVEPGHDECAACRTNSIIAAYADQLNAEDRDDAADRMLPDAEALLGWEHGL